jgi:hypothetical protein
VSPLSQEVHNKLFNEVTQEDNLWTTVHRSKTKAFLGFGQSDGESLHILCAKLKTRTASSLKRAGQTEAFNSASYKSRLDSQGRFDIAKEASTVVQDRLDFGPQSHAPDCFRGYIPLEKALENNMIEKGTQAAADLFNDRLVLAIDLGIVNVVGSVAALGHTTLAAEENDVQFLNYKFNWMKWLLPSRNFYTSTGIDKHLQTQLERYSELEEEMVTLSKFHSRTMDVEEFKKHSEVFRAKGPALLAKSCSKEKLSDMRVLRATKQRYLDEIINTIYAIDEALHEKKSLGSKRTKAPIIIAGKPTFTGVQGKRSVPSSSILDYLKRHFAVILVDEYNTSQKCPKCCGQLEEAEGIRIKVCPNVECRSTKCTGEKIQFHVNRDVSAPMNMIRIAFNLICGQERPKPFQIPRKPQDKANESEMAQGPSTG